MKREALSYAFKLLSKRDYFSSELKDKLVKKGFDPEESDQVVQYLVQKGYLDDQKLKERLSSLLKEKGKSPIYIKKKFYSKGVEPPEISYDEEFETAYNLLKKKYKKEKQFHTVVKFLKNRGFSYSVIIDVANKFLEEEE
ncbi:MAG TPA: regulatory protein RecX [Persephonella sp.]|uniref:Regulatory protein RecX n=1 Tax=Persephonella marina (strain DSM 14350 / EX-H1) TaxID=123214 RepID=C0QSS8_PERMH|nr:MULTISPECIES: regulatory protein RecX [Persephonella]ACO04903.1 regulatory protein RecX [Persephonella marina EX-H1]HCB70638.1 regulatory protein RecX [Persephonella sp.]